MLAFTAWAEAFYTRHECRRKTYKFCHVHDTVSLHHVVFLANTCRHLLGVSFVTSCKSNLRTAVTIENTEENNCMISPAQNATEL